MPTRERYSEGGEMEVTMSVGYNLEEETIKSTGITLREVVSAAPERNGNVINTC